MFTAVRTLLYFLIWNTGYITLHTALDPPSPPSAPQSPRLYNPLGSPHIVAVDCGMKNNQIRCLAMRGAAVKVVPWDYNFNQEEGED